LLLALLPQGLSSGAEIIHQIIYFFFDQIVNGNRKVSVIALAASSPVAHLTIRTPYGGGISGGLIILSHLKFFAHIPGESEVIPRNPYQAKGLLRQNSKFE
jgi:2-oxoisovalerate dehydrogenase E1 component beta subunit